METQSFVLSAEQRAALLAEITPLMASDASSDAFMMSGVIIALRALGADNATVSGLLRDAEPRPVAIRAER